MIATNLRRRISAVLDATRSDRFLQSICEVVGKRNDVSATVLYRPSNRERVLATLSKSGLRCRAINCGENGTGLSIAVIRDCEGALLAYFPCEAEVDPTCLAEPRLRKDRRNVMPLLPAVTIGAQISRLRISSAGWAAPADLVADWLVADPHISDWSLPFLFEAAQRQKHRLNWSSCELSGIENPVAGCSGQPALGPQSKVLAVVPHYGCEEYLSQCLYSLTNQTRPPNNIAVIDDASAVSPREIVADYPGVTLLSTSARAGPENILDSVILRTLYDAYMVQDADDWCAEDRLERQLGEAARTGAEMVGSQELRFLEQERELGLYVFPLDASRAVVEGADHPLVHGASLIARSLAMRVGGFDCSLVTVADTDFALRAAYAGQIVNVPAFCYYRRLRPGSRTSAPDTGHDSQLRVTERKSLMERASRNVKNAREGRNPDVVSRTHSSPVEFRHQCGPALLGMQK
jgi:glycosyltransferase involved in cell wall biosynthesis